LLAAATETLRSLRWKHSPSPDLRDRLDQPDRKVPLDRWVHKDCKDRRA
jgi:hypothetical protein